ncbi:hypothetical protein E4K72_13565 [Oxalobacteraceae bacterium OM1]|nr:hypothetical protein E4K72_13565 [Oxalobacteraceae bacterium OM1]
METRLTRRTFLKAGLAGAAVLAVAGGLYGFTRRDEPLRPFIFDSGPRSVLAAVIPVMLKDAVENTPAALDTAIARVQGAVSGLPLVTQKEIQDLFGLLVLAPGRRLLAGVHDDWAAAKPDDVAAFLESWRFHRIGLFQSAYLALHDLIAGSWYADESTWASIGYPGPLKELS